MSEKTLNLGKSFHVPRAIAARTNFIAGTKGSGKTYTAGVLAEELLESEVHVVILDPLGVWWGLRHDEKGGPGGYPIVILGGEHGDRPLLPTAGTIVAEYLVKSGQSVILDMSGFDSNAAQDRFVTDLLHKLFRLKATDKSAVHLIIDEADMFAPQSPSSATEIPLLGATKTIVTKGRSRGLSMTMITQRPQSIAKSAIEEADVVLCHRMQGVNAVKAMKAWTDLYASKEEAATFFGTLPTLDDGECWVWSPQFLKLFERKQIRRKRTFDSSRTPDPGETARKPKAAAAVDLDKLTDEMKATADEVAKNDPAALRRRVAELEKAVAQGKPAVAGPGKADPQTARDLQIAKRTIAELKKGLETAMKVMAEINAKGFDAVGIDPEVVKKAVESAAAQIVKAATTELGRKQAEFDRLRDQVRKSIAAMQKLLEGSDVKVQVDVQRNEPFSVTSSTAVARGATMSGGDASLDKPTLKILGALSWWRAVGVDRPSLPQMAALADYAVGGTLSTYLGRMTGAGLIERADGKVWLTAEGSAKSPNVEAPLTLDELHARALATLDGPGQTILRALLKYGSEGTTTEQLGADAGYAVGGTFSTYLGRLSSRGLIDRARGRVTPTNVLFPDGLA